MVERHAGPLEVRSAGSVFRIETGDAQITTIGPADRIVRDGDRVVVVDARGAEPILVSVAGDLGIGLLQFQGGGLGDVGIVQVANEAPWAPAAYPSAPSWDMAEIVGELSTPQWLRESIHRWPWVQEGWPTPRRTSEEDHRAALQTPFEVDSETADFLSADELALVRRHGTWMEGLTSGKLGATTSTQERFVKAAWGLVDPETPHERAWTMYLAGKYWVPK